MIFYQFPKFYSLSFRVTGHACGFFICTISNYRSCQGDDVGFGPGEVPPDLAMPRLWTKESYVAPKLMLASLKQC